MNSRIIILILGLAVVVAFSGIGTCADNIQPKQELKKVQAPPKAAASAKPTAAASKDAQPKPAGIMNMSKEEIITDLKDALESEDEILSATPGLKAEKDAKGNIFYTYNGTKIEDLGKDQLEPLAMKVHQAGTRIRTDRIQRQLETVQRVERLNAISAPRMPPPSPPAAVSQPPRSPAIVSQPPRAPSAPPSPPRR